MVELRSSKAPGQAWPRRTEGTLPSSRGRTKVPPGQRDLEVGRGFLRDGARPPAQEVNAYIDAHKDCFGVEPICRALQVAPSTYCAAKALPICFRARSDAELKA